MITITNEFAQEIKDILEKLTGPDDETEKRRIDLIGVFSFWLEEEKPE